MFEVKVNPTDRESKAYVAVDLGGDVQLLGPSEHGDGHKTVVFKYVSPLEMRKAAAVLLEEADLMTDAYAAEIEGYPGFGR